MKEILNEFLEQLNELEKTISEPFKAMISFIKKHKKLIIFLGIGYVVVSYLLHEE